MTEPSEILGLTPEEFLRGAALRGMRRPRAIECYRAAFRDARALEPWIALDAASLGVTQVEGETVKFTQRHPDGLETESVLIPMRGRSGTNSHTLCVSSQIGCAMGCRFCETAQMGLMRDLSAAQIVGQWFAAAHALGIAPKNIVFMGMGEPMDNLDAVLQAIRVLTAHDGARVAASNISVSTVGHVEGIRRYAEFTESTGFRRCHLAVSLNAPNDRIRAELMPISRRWSMADLREAMLGFQARRPQPLCIEYVLIPGVNDEDLHCDEVCAYLRGIRCSLNVIPYNPRRDSPWPAPDEDRVTRFVARAIENGQFVKRRQTKGRSVMGACGQLGNAHIRHRRHIEVPAAVRVGGIPEGACEAPCP